MKKIKIISICIAAALIVGVSVFAIASADKQSGDGTEKRAAAQATKKFEPVGSGNINKDSLIIPAKRGTELKYVSTKSYTEKVILDIYVDENGNQYKYDMKGNLRDFTTNTEWYTSEELKPVSEDKIKQAALEYAEAMYGDIAKELVVSKVIDMQGLYDGYKVRLSTKHGKEKFINGVYCYIDVLKDGSFYGCTISRYYEDEFANYDWSKLDDITEKEVKDSIERQIKEKHGDDVKFEYFSIDLVIIEGKYKISCAVFVDEGEGTVGEEYYYELD